MKCPDLIHEVLDLCLREGATDAEILLRKGLEFSTTVRLGEVEKLSQASFGKLGIRVLKGSRSALAATSDLSLDGIRILVKEILEMANYAGEDPEAGLPASSDYEALRPDLELCFGSAVDSSTEQRIALARECETSAFRADSRISNSEGASFSNTKTQFCYGNSLGILDGFSRSVYTLSMTALAEGNGRKQRDYWLSTSLNFSSLELPESVGSRAAERTLSRVGSRKVPTCTVPVIFDPIAAASVLRHVATSVSGTSLMRKATFMLGMLGRKVASPMVTVIDDGKLALGLGSRIFDSEGIHSRTSLVINEGILENYLLDSYAARKLRLRSTGSSDREPHTGQSSGPSNFFLQPGSPTPEDLISSIKNGFLVTELIGFGVDVVSGNYSQGAAGMWIEDGRLSYPVDGVTIAGNLRDMLTSVQGVGNDPVRHGEVFAPSLLIDKMVVSGS